MSRSDLVAKIIGRESTNKLAVKFFKACPGYNIKVLQGHYLKQHPSGKIVPPQKLVPELFNVYYGKGNPADIVPDETTSFVSAFVPFFRGITNLLIFNFLQRNYGLRDPILLRLSVLAGERHFWSKQYLFSPNEVKFIKNFAEEAGHDVLPERGIILLEAFHPRIKTPGNEFRFFVIFRDPIKGVLSGVHSTPAPIGPYVNRRALCYRAHVPKEERAYYCNFFDPHQVIDRKRENSLFREAKTIEPVKGSWGFCIIHDEDGTPITLWHDNCSKNTSNIRISASKKEPAQPCMTTFYVPDFELHAPLIRVSPYEIGFSTSSMILRAYRTSGEFICEKIVTLNEDPSGFDLAKVFAGEGLKGEICFVADLLRYQHEFDKPPICFLHLHYRCGNALADQNHTQHTYASKNDPLAKPQSYRCLKMAPLFKELKTVLAVATGGIVGGELDRTINLRVFTDTGTEHVFNDYPLTVPEGTSLIYGDDLIRDIGAHIKETAVVWFEHQTTNFNGVWFAIDRKTGYMATDHFSGA